MKNLIAFVAVFAAVSLLGCQDSKDDTTSLADISSIRKIGMQIPNETGEAWMEAYQKSSAQGRSLLLTPYSVSDENLEAAINSVNTFAGVAFHHAIDNSGEHHFIVIPVDASLLLFPAGSGKIFIDANTNTIISQATAEEWTASYEQANPHKIWFHFFGGDIFDDILATPFFDNLDIHPAINILNLTPQLLLIISDDSLLGIGGRAKGEGTVTYDASSPCPPCPVR